MDLAYRHLPLPLARVALDRVARERLTSQSRYLRMERQKTWRGKKIQESGRDGEDIGI